MKNALLIIILVAIGLFAATGDITTPRIDVRGYSITFNIEGIDSGGVFKFNWGHDTIISNDDTTIARIPTDSTPFINVKTFGYDTTDGSRNFVTRKVYIDTVFRRNYPNNEMDSTVVYGAVDSILVTCALSEFVFVHDTVESLFIPKNIYYLSTDTQLQITASSVLNSSNRTYSEVPCKANWNSPPRSVHDTDFVVRMHGVHRSAKLGMPFACVIFTAEDNNSNVFRDTVRHLSIEDTEFTDSIKIPEYICTVSVATFTKNDSITVNFKALPWWGDSLWTGDGVNATKPTPLYAPQMYLYAEYYIAHVNDTGTSGAVVLKDSYDPDNPPARYPTIYEAINGIRAAVGAANIKGGVIYIEAGDYTLYGGTVTSGTFSSFNLTLSNFRSDSVNITGKVGSASMPADSYMKGHGLNFTQSTGNMLLLENAWWIDSCFDRGSGGIFLYVNPCNYATRCKFDQDLDLPFSTQNNPLAIGRGNEFRATGSVITPYCFIGSYTAHLTALTLKMEFNSMTNPKPTGSLVSYCRTTLSTSVTSTYADSSTTNGPAFINNIFEQTTNSGDLLAAAVGDNSLVVNAVEFYNNTFVGDKFNYAYNNVGLTDSTNLRYRELWVLRNNILHLSHIVTDDDVHGGAAGNKRNGNWSVVFGLSCYANFIVSYTNTWTQDFPGAKSASPNITFTNDGSVNDYILFVGDSSWAGSAAGYGDYHLQATSPAILFTDNQAFGFDMDGNVRESTGAVGAYGYDEGGCPAPSISNITFSCTLTVAASEQMTVSNEDSVIAIETLPTGLSISTGGLITGTPTVKAAVDSFLIVAYSCEGDSTDTAKAFITVDQDSSITITKQPYDTVLAIGATTGFYVIDSSDIARSYQWDRKEPAGAWTIESGETDSTLAFVTTYVMDGDSFRVRIYNDYESDTSTAVILDVTPDTATITGHPSNQSVPVGTAATFTITMAGDPTPSVKWQIKPVGGAWGDTAGQTSTTFNWSPNDTDRDFDTTRAIITNAGGSDTSTLAVLHVYPIYTIDTVFAVQTPITTNHASLSFDSLALCTLFCTPAAGYNAYWPGDTVYYPDTDTLIITVTEDSTVTATAHIDTNLLSLTVVGIGTVDTLPSGKGGLFAYGEPCSLVASYGADSAIAYSGDTSSTNDTLILTMTTDKSITATFYSLLSSGSDRSLRWTSFRKRKWWRR